MEEPSLVFSFSLMRVHTKIIRTLSSPAISKSLTEKKSLVSKSKLPLFQLVKSFHGGENIPELGAGRRDGPSGIVVKPGAVHHRAPNIHTQAYTVILL